MQYALETELSRAEYLCTFVFANLEEESEESDSSSDEGESPINGVPVSDKFSPSSAENLPVEIEPDSKTIQPKTERIPIIFDKQEEEEAGLEKGKKHVSTASIN